MTYYASLYSGCGGFDHGFSREGFECLGAYDIEPSAVNVYRKNIDENVFEHDLTEELLPNHDQSKEAELLLAGSPCQGFSTVGQRKFDDPRNKLLIRSAEIALDIRPKVVICENVPAVKSGKHKFYWDQLTKLLSSADYHVEEFLYNFSDLSLPQIRKRLFLIAYRGKKVPKESLVIPSASQLSLQKAINGAHNAPNHEYTELNGESRDELIANKIRIGQKLSNVRGGDLAVHTWEIPEVYGHVSESEERLLVAIRKLRRKIRKRDFGDADPLTIDELSDHYEYPFKRDLKSLIKKGYIVEKSPGLYDLKNTFNGKFRKLHPDKPSLTVDTNFWNPRYFLHPFENRGFSVREAARIQGFPDDFVFEGTLKQQFTMVGNAVPPTVSRSLAILIKDIFFS